MHKNLIIALVLLATSIACNAQDSIFSKESFSWGGTTLQYRKAVVAGNEPGKSIMVMYLHGGTSKGNDNEKQLQEEGVDSIYSFLNGKHTNAIMLVPQCPSDKYWLGPMLGVLRALVREYTDQGIADPTRIYIMGGSMGGTGTWNMISNYPDVFAAAMPTAGNPDGLDAQNVSQTPVYTVMGTADKIMSIPTVQSFLEKMDDYDAEYVLDCEEGWTHEDVCTKSYTKSRLDWVLSHTKSQAVVETVTCNDDDVVSTTWFTIGGQRLTGYPTQSGIYIKTTVYSNGKTIANKYYIR